MAAVGKSASRTSPISRDGRAPRARVSDDGRYMLFQDGRGGMEAGQGFSIYLYDFVKAGQAK